MSQDTDSVENAVSDAVAEPQAAPGRFAWLSHPRLPVFVGAALIAAAALVTAHQLKPGWFRFGSSAVVVFDPVKFLNAQRSAAAILATNPNAELSLTLTQVAKQAEAVIKEEAGGALVLVKQAVVGADQYQDITDAVLTRFGLGTDAPTVTIKPGLAIEDIAPTDFAFSKGALTEDYRMELKRRSQELQEDVKKAGTQMNVIP